MLEFFSLQHYYHFPNPLRHFFQSKRASASRCLSQMLICISTFYDFLGLPIFLHQKNTWPYFLLPYVLWLVPVRRNVLTLSCRVSLYSICFRMPSFLPCCSSEIPQHPWQKSCASIALRSFRTHASGPYSYVIIYNQ